MSRRAPSWILWACAIVSLVAGVGLTAGAWREVRAARHGLRRSLRDLEELEVLRGRLEPYRGAEAAFESLPVKRPVAVREFLADRTEGWNPDDLRESEEEMTPGWTAHRIELAFGVVPIARIMDLVHCVETPVVENGVVARPPWRLTKCVIRASPDAVGNGWVVLVLVAAGQTE